MRQPDLATVCTVGTLSEAEEALDCLRKAGFHPAELALTTPITINGSDEKFPIEVPVEEAQEAKNVLKGPPS